MNVSFDALPLISGRMTGIGWCEAGQTTALARLHPEDKFYYNFFSRKDDHIKIERLSPFSENISPKIAHFSGYIYRVASTYLPVPYKHFFGKDADITHFFNYIAPPESTAEQLSPFTTWCTKHSPKLYADVQNGCSIQV